MTTYRWGHGYHIAIDPQAAGERMEALRAKHGALTPEVVLADATSPRSPLHGHFEWNDTEAAKQYRLQQAYELLRACVIVDTVEERPPVRALVAVMNPETYGETRRREYHRIEDVLTNPVYRAQHIQHLLDTIEQWSEQAARFEELAAMRDVIVREAPVERAKAKDIIERAKRKSGEGRKRGREAESASCVVPAK